AAQAIAQIIRIIRQYLICSGREHRERKIPQCRYSLILKAKPVPKAMTAKARGKVRSRAA
ncbi:MAG: hypothetical protein DA445_03060, partial [Bacteroidetes bacterium]